MAKIFISYSHQSRQHVQKVRELGDRLSEAGFNVVLDQYVKFPKHGWAAWAEKEIQSADHVVVVGSRTYLRRYSGDERSGTGYGSTWEAALVRQLLYESGTANTRFVPIVFGHESTNTLPPLLRQYQVFKLWRDWEAMTAHLSGDQLSQKAEPRREKLRSKPSDRSRKRPARKTPRSAADHGHVAWLDPIRGRHLLEMGLDSILHKCRDVAVSLLILDVDNLTQINKRFGDSVGDIVLHEIGRICVTGSAEQHAGRCGDDTFFVVIIGRDLDAARKFASRLRDRIRQIEWRRVAQGLHVSLSGGLAQHQTDEPGVQWALRAAQGMIAAKEKGGNRVENGPLFLDRVATGIEASGPKIKRAEQPRFTLTTDLPKMKIDWPFS